MRGWALGAVDAAGQDTRGTGLAAASRAGEQIGMREPALVKGSHQRNRDLVLADHTFKGVRTIATIQCKCHSY